MTGSATTAPPEIETPPALMTPQQRTAHEMVKQYTNQLDVALDRVDRKHCTWRPRRRTPPQRRALLSAPPFPPRPPRPLSNPPRSPPPSPPSVLWTASPLSVILASSTTAADAPRTVARAARQRSRLPPLTPTRPPKFVRPPLPCPAPPPRPCPPSPSSHSRSPFGRAPGDAGKHASTFHGGDHTHCRGAALLACCHGCYDRHDHGSRSSFQNCCPSHSRSRIRRGLCPPAARRPSRRATRTHHR